LVSSSQSLWYGSDRYSSSKSSAQPDGCGQSHAEQITIAPERRIVKDSAADCAAIRHQRSCQARLCDIAGGYLRKAIVWRRSFTPLPSIQKAAVEKLQRLLGRDWHKLAAFQCLMHRNQSP
jgi:hypothetical protein